MTETFKTTIDIQASPEAVFDHFVEPGRLVRWMGEFARLDAKEGGEFSVDIGGVLIRGHYLTLDRPRLIEIAWGEKGNAQMPPGTTRLRVELAPSEHGTVLTLIHSGLVPEEAKKHAVGWPHFLARLAEAGAGRDPGKDPWLESPPSHA